VHLCPKGSKEVLEVFITNVFDAEVIHTQGELDGSCNVFPEARHVGLFEVSMACKTEFKELVGKDAGACGRLYIPFMISM
jgi:hypothetical protein